MEKAKAAVTDFLSKDGKHKTSVHQDHAQAVTEEHIRPHRHEEVTSAVDREVHRDHHYTTIQPISHTETLPEQHHHNVIPVEHKTVQHGGVEDMDKTLERESAKYVDASTTHETTHSTTTIPVVTGEHVHHHVHEHVQPVIQKETIQPHVVHTVIPVHETHHAPPVHHGTKIAPIKTLEEFTSGGGLMEGRPESDLREYEGCPQSESSSAKGSHHTAAKTAAAGATAAGAAAAIHKHSSDKNTDSATKPIDNRESSLGTAALGSSQTTREKNSDGFNSSTTGTGEDVSKLADTLRGPETRARENETTANHGATKAAVAGGAGALATEAATSTSDKNDKHGSMFGKDKVDRLEDTEANPSTTNNSTESRSFLKKNNSKKEHNVLRKERRSISDDDRSADTTRTGTDAISESTARTSDLSGGDNYKTGAVDNTTAGTTTTGTKNIDAVPRSEAAKINESDAAGDIQPWHAGETHQTQPIAEKVHEAGVHHRASLISKINPFKDSDGDGKKGFMK